MEEEELVDLYNSHMTCRNYRAMENSSKCFSKVDKGHKIAQKIQLTEANRCLDLLNKKMEQLPKKLTRKQQEHKKELEKKQEWIKKEREIQEEKRKEQEEANERAKLEDKKVTVRPGAKHGEIVTKVYMCGVEVPSFLGCLPCASHGDDAQHIELQ